MEKTTLVIGASTNVARFSNKCVNALSAHQIPVVAIGLREGMIGSTSILTGFPKLEGIHTVSLYLNPANQVNYFNFIQELNPARVIFNPGTENPAFHNILISKGIEVRNDCTLIMLGFGDF